MYNIESDEQKRQRTSACLYRYLTQCSEIPKDIQVEYGFDKEYELLQRLNRADAESNHPRRNAEEIYKHLSLDARVTRLVEKAFESVCNRPPVEYLDKLNEELEKLGQIAVMPDKIHDILHIHSDFLAKYGIDRKASRQECSKQAEKAYRELDARFVKMTDRPSYADSLFDRLKTGQGSKCNDKADNKVDIRPKIKTKGRKLGL